MTQAPPTLRLVEPNRQYREAFLRLLADYEQAGERFRHGRIHNQARWDFDRYVADLRANARGRGLRPGWVPHTMYWLLAGEEIAGETTLRHYLTPDLMDEGGHIGYRITPAFRRQGCGTRLLALMLEEARRVGLPRVLVTCDADNIGSGKIIRANGGVYDGDVTSPHSGKPVSRYWITLDAALAARDVPPAGGEERRIFDELTLFVTRGRRLLLQEQSGIVSLPTGTVSRRESYSNAGWRTLYMEAGLARPRLAAILGSRETRLEDGQTFLVATSGLTHLPAGRTMSGRLRRGTPVAVLDRRGEYAEVIHQDFVTDARGARRLRASISGWLPAPLLATHHVRHFIHMVHQDGGPESFHHRTRERRLRLFWAPLNGLPPLPAGHQEWLDMYRGELARS